MSALAIRGRVVAEDEVWHRGTVLVENGRIEKVSRDALDADQIVEMPGSYLVPGFVDLQVNGAFGVDVVDHPDRLDDLSAALPRTGVTSYLPTLVTLPLHRYPRIIGELSSQQGPGAEPLGVHLEGPFINPEKRGAHPAEAVIPPDPKTFGELLGTGRVAMATLAPELPGVHRLLEISAGRGVAVSLGHSAASFEEAWEALERGAPSVTHLFNAMSPLHHRDPGLPGAALAHPGPRCSLVADGRHVHPEMVRLAFDRLGPDRVYLVTDAMSAAGMGSGEFELAGRKVTVQEGTPRLDDGTLAGSVLTMDEAVRNVMSFTGCTLPEAVRMASVTPSTLLGAERKGRLARGFDADVVALSASLEVEAAWAGGELVCGSSPGSTEKSKDNNGDLGAVWSREPRPTPLDNISPARVLRLMNSEDTKIVSAVQRALSQLERVVESAREALAGGGRVVYAGAGTSGRLAVAEAAECSPTFGVDPGSFVGLMAGGLEAVAVEEGAAEDDAAEGRRRVSELDVGGGDLFVAVSASGETRFTLAAQLAARGRGARTACIVNAPASEMAENADHPVEILTDAEILSGSTRLKAGTAQKLALNMISTAALAGLGCVYGNLMVGMRPGNRKLHARAEEMVRRITGCSAREAGSALERSGYDIRTAVLLIDGAGSVGEATRLLRQADGFLRPAREAVPVSGQ